MDRLQTHLFNVGLRVFEELCFTLPDPVPDEEQAYLAPEAAVTVEFTGPVKGMVLLILRGQILSTLAANMLGEDDPPTEFQKDDALREMANIVCGNFLPYIGGSDAVFDISPPQIRELQGLESIIPNDTGIKQSIGLEGGRADLQLFIWAGSLPQES